MKKYIWPSVKLTLIFILLCSVIYPLFIAGVSKLASGQGKGETISVNGKVVGYERVGQKFTDDKYFQGRPSTVDYNADGSAGSNMGPINQDYLHSVQERIDSFLVHNPGVRKEDIPVDLVTASGSGLDPDISPEAAYVQVKRIAGIRGLTEEKLRSLVDQQVEKPFLGPAHVHVLRLNIALDHLK